MREDNEHIVGRSEPQALKGLTIIVGLALCAAIAAGPADAADRKRPTKPKAFTATAVNGTTVSVSWRRSRDNVRVRGYRLFRNGRLVANVKSRRRYALRGLRCGTRYLLMLYAYDAARNRSRPATTFARTKPCARRSGPGPGPGPGPGSGVAPPACPTSPTVVALLLEHKILYGCDWPDGAHAKQALESVRALLATRDSMLVTPRAKRWLGIALDELADATGLPGAWTSDGVLQPNAAGLAAQYKVGRVIRILHWHNPELYEASKAEKWALTAVSWYIAASEYNRRLAQEGPTPTLNRTLYDLRRGDDDFFALSCYRAWGRYLQAWQRMTGV